MTSWNQQQADAMERGRSLSADSHQTVARVDVPNEENRCPAQHNFNGEYQFKVKVTQCQELPQHQRSKIVNRCYSPIDRSDRLEFVRRLRVDLEASLSPPEKFNHVLIKSAYARTVQHYRRAFAMKQRMKQCKTAEQVAQLVDEYVVSSAVLLEDDLHFFNRGRTSWAGIRFAETAASAAHTSPSPHVRNRARTVGSTIPIPMSKPISMPMPSPGVASASSPMHQGRGRALTTSAIPSAAANIPARDESCAMSDAAMDEGADNIMSEAKEANTAPWSVQNRAAQGGTPVVVSMAVPMAVQQTGPSSPSNPTSKSAFQTFQRVSF